jgi:hypothetical protein
MTDQEVQLFLADLAIIILFARLLGRAAKRLGQPPVLGEIIAGILLGPTLFSRQDRGDAVPDHAEAAAERTGQPRRCDVHVRHRVPARSAPDPRPRARRRERVGQFDHSSAVTWGWARV